MSDETPREDAPDDAHVEPRRSPAVPPPRPAVRQGLTVRGFFSAIGIAIAGGVMVAAVTQGFALLFIGVAQIVYMLPAWIVFRRNDRSDVTLSLVIVASLTFLLNAACWGWAAAVLQF